MKNEQILFVGTLAVDSALFLLVRFFFGTAGEDDLSKKNNKEKRSPFSGELSLIFTLEFFFEEGLFFFLGKSSGSKSSSSAFFSREIVRLVPATLGDGFGTEL